MPSPPPATNDGQPEEELDDAVVGEPSEKKLFDAAVKELQNAQNRQKGSNRKQTEEVSRDSAAPLNASPTAQAMPLVPVEEKKGHIMLSYCWAAKEVVKKLHKALVDVGVKVWFDEEEMHGPTIDRMAEAVEGAQAIVLCFSKGYKNSNNCKSEAEYAREHRKPIVEVLPTSISSSF